jgi:hypothetical protein
MTEVPDFLCTEFDISTHKAKQVSTVASHETIYQPIASVVQTGIEYLIPGDNDSYIDLDIKLFIKRQLLKEDGIVCPATEYTTGINNLLNSLFIQCSITLNCTQITQVSKLYNYRAYLETRLTYGYDAVQSHLQMSYWDLERGNMMGGDATKPAETTNGGFISSWDKMKEVRQLKSSVAFILI